MDSTSDSTAIVIAAQATRRAFLTSDISCLLSQLSQAPPEVLRAACIRRGGPRAPASARAAEDRGPGERGEHHRAQQVAGRESLVGLMQSGRGLHLLGSDL